MVALRSRRLEDVLGGSLEDLTFERVERLVAGGVTEAFDLDFKQALYGTSDAARRDLATDVAALANTSGGLLILGIEEDDQARAIAAPGVALSDDELNRIHQIVGSQVVPAVVYEPIPVRKPGQDDHGFLVIAVLRDPLAPHAVIVNQGLRFPVRNGTTIRYLSEPEVAAAYRERSMGAERQAARVEEIERDALERLDPASGSRWVVVSLVPDLAGDLAINSGSFAAFRQEVIGQSATIVPSGARFRRASVGRRRLVADGTMDSSAAASGLLLELHADGAGVCCISVVNRTREVSPSADADEPAVSRIHVEDMVVAVMSGLWQLGRHARDRAAVSGSAIVRVQIYPVAPDQQAVLVNTRDMGFYDRLGDRALAAPQRPAEAVSDLDGLAQPGAALIEVSALLASEIGQSFGVAELGQLSPAGQIRRRYWSIYQSQIEAWARRNDIAISEDTPVP